jgi:hypothetical protein
MLLNALVCALPCELQLCEVHCRWLCFRIACRVMCVKECFMMPSLSVNQQRNVASVTRALHANLVTNCESVRGFGSGALTDDDSLRDFDSITGRGCLQSNKLKRYFRCFSAL